MRLTRRVRALERATGGDRCGTCGHGCREEARLAVCYGDEPAEGPDVCPECGRPLVLRIVYKQVPVPQQV